MIVAILFILGLCLGSFVNALVWRTKQKAQSSELRAKSRKLTAKDFQLSAGKNLSIFTGRSQCTNCHHQLAAKDLVPVLSWTILRGRCRYCRQKISAQYPLVEIAGAVVFAASYFFWFNPVELVVHSTGVGPIGGGQWTLLATWLAASVGLLALAVYDLRWMLLPNRILYPTFAVALSGRLAYILFFAQDKAHSSWLLALSILVASGIFWLLFELSRGRLIGFGDVRLGLITGTLLADPLKSLAMIFIASLLGSLVAIPALLLGKKSMGTRLSYGPFLITAAFIVILFGDGLIDWYQRLLL